jgi:hypothetical protein
MASRRRTRALSKANRVTDAPDAKNMKTLPTKALNELVIVTDNGGGLSRDNSATSRSRREAVGCEHKSRPASGNRPKPASAPIVTSPSDT